MTKCDKCGKEILDKVIICNECQAEYENDINAKTPAFVEEYEDNEHKDKLAKNAIVSALEFAIRFGKSSCMGLYVQYDGEYHIYDDNFVEATCMNYDDAEQVLYDFYKTHYGNNKQVIINAKKN